MADLLSFPEVARPQVATRPRPDAGPPTIPDAAERAQALDTTRSFIVEAPAGSGKTGLLIQRFLKLLASASVEQPAQVLAITFTRKATAELRERVFRQLREAAAGSLPDDAFDEATRPLAEAALARSAELGWNLLEDPRRLNIRTIDSVCADLARGLPVLSGSGGSQQPTEDAAALHAEAARRTLMLLGGEDETLNEALRSLLLRRDGNLAQCETLIADMLAVRDQWGELVPLSRRELDDDFLDTVVLPRLERALDLAICRALTRLTQILPAPLLDRLCTLACEMAEAEGYKGAASPIAICKARDQPPGERAEDLDHWRALIHLLVKPSKPRDWRKAVSGNIVGFDILKQHQAELKAIIARLSDSPGLVDALCEIEALPPAQYPRDQWRVAKALFRVLSRALVELQFVFAARGRCDFIEPALEARFALGREGALDDLHASPAFDLQHLLVDEMQDTSSAQYELIQLLTESWDGSSQTVFLVGDPKQSIYLFRQARVERFVHTLHTLRLGVAQGDQMPLTALRLTANFRTQRTLVGAFNDTFTALFPAAPDPTRRELVPYRPAAAVRPPTSATLNWHAAVLPYVADTEQCRLRERDQRRADAFAIRQLAEAALARNPRAHIAVLVRNRTHLLEVVAAFKTEPAIPYRAVEIEPLGERQEILDLLALTRALLHPADRVAWLALLRTPWCGLTLADLHLLAGADDPACARRNLLDLMRERGDLLSEDGIARLQPFFTAMSHALNRRERVALSRLVEDTARIFGAHRFATPEAASNAGRFFALLGELEAGGAIDLATLATRLKKLFAAPAIHPGAVDFLTIHKAKGLEWDVVLVPGLDRASRVNSGRLFSWLELDAGNELSDPDVAHGIVAPIKSKGGAGQQLNDWMRSIDNGREAAERTRLFYVACTRAREELHLFACVSARSKGEIVAPPGSLLAAAWPAAEAHFQAPTVQTQFADAIELVPHSSRPHRDEWVEPLQLAAAADTPARIIQRIPAGAMTLPTTASTPLTPAAFPRPEGSFSARAFGNTMHAFLERLAATMPGSSASALLAELPTWSPRIVAVLRATGLAATLVERFAANILRGLTQTLRSPDGQWLLAPHPGAATESSFAYDSGEGPATLRLDRAFLAGSTPGSSGSSHLWIVDYKTATHGKEGLEEFLQKEELKYRGQLETYAAQMQQNLPIKLALFYPMIPTLRLL